jgi:hypothetical protein
MSSSLPGRNEVCPCGSGKKYKRCCGAPGSLVAVAAPATAAADMGSADEPSPDDPNFIPWMRNKIKDLPPEERREFERIMAAMMPDLRQAGKEAQRAPAAAPARAAPDVAEPAAMDPALWKVLESAVNRFPNIQATRKRRATSPLDILLVPLATHPEAPLIPLDELVPWVMELAGKVRTADHEGVKQHWWQFKHKPLSQEIFNELVQEAAERIAVALSTPERWSELTEELQSFLQRLAEDEDEVCLSAEAQNAAEAYLAKGPAAASDFLVQLSILSLSVAFRQITGDDAD